MTSLLIPFFICFILIYAFLKKIDVYSSFIEGAKEGIKIAVDILPYMLAIIVAIGMFRASGTIELLQSLLKPILDFIKVPIDVMPIMIVRSLSGSGVLALFTELTQKLNPDSYAIKLAAIMVGSSETTFYVLSVYFGSVGIKKIRYALYCGLLADIFSIILSIIIADIFFGI